MIPRIIAPEVVSALSRQAAVALIGPRQVGKTTLALELARSRDALYLDLEDRDDRNRLAEPALFLDNAEDRLVILDEIHRMPELFQTLRGVIDRGRRRGKGKGRFLILGSASIDLLRQSGETLAGRIAYIDMAPLSALEVEDARPSRERLWLRGGFPDSYLAGSDRDSLALRRDFVRTYLERDVAAFGPPCACHHSGAVVDDARTPPGDGAERLGARQSAGSERAVGDPLHRSPGGSAAGAPGCPLCTPTSASVS